MLLLAVAYGIEVGEGIEVVGMQSKKEEAQRPKDCQGTARTMQ